MTENIKTKNSILKMGILLFVGSFLITSVAYYYRVRDLPGKSMGIPVMEGKTTPTIKPETMLYRSRQFGYTVRYNSNLETQALENPEGLLQFIVFQSRIDSEDRGFAIAVSSMSTDAEVKKIKDRFINENVAILEEEKNIVFKDLQAKRLYYKPRDQKLGEDRIIIVFNNNGFTYSISAHPGDIDKVLEGFNFTSGATRPTQEVGN